MRQTVLSFLLIFSLAWCNTLVAQSALTGTYTVGLGASDDFNSISQCTDSLEILGVSGPVLISIDTGIFSERLDIKSIPGASATRTITFQGKGHQTIIRYTPTATDQAVISVDGASHLIFDSLRVEAIGTYGIGFNLYGEADTITIRNCYILLPNTSAGSACTGIANYSSNDGTGTSNVNNITISNDTIQSGSIGIRLFGNLSDASNFLVENTTITDFGFIGILVNSNSESTYRGNAISSAETGARSAISMWPTGRNISIENNKLELGSNVIHTRVLQVAGEPGSGGTNWGQQALIANNMVRYYGTQNNNITGIYTKHVSYMKIYNNTVQMASGSGAVSLWLDALSTTSNLVVKNNLLSSSVSNATLFRVHNLNTAITADYNNYYNSSGMSIGWKGTNYSTLASYRTASSQGTNSVSINPNYISTTDLHADSTNAAFDALGTYVAEVTTDIDGETRSTSNPDIGADEFDSKADVALGAIVFPGNCLPSNPSISFAVWLKNEGPYAISGIPIAYQINSNAIVQETYGGTIPHNDSVLYAFSTSGDFSGYGLYTIKAFTQLRADQDLSNDSATSSLAISGLFSNMQDSIGTCLGKEVEVASNASSTATSFLWSDGSINSTLTIDAMDVVLGKTSYKVKLMDANGCYVYDSVAVIAFAPATIALGADTSICLGDSIVLGQNITSGTYLWNNNSTARTITTSNPGFYYVQVSSGFGCTVADSLWLGFFQLPKLNLNNTAVICRGDSLLLDPGGDFALYKWNDMSTSTTLAAYEAAKYWVDVVDTNGCVGSDSITIYLNEVPKIDLGRDTIKCSGSDVLLNVSLNNHTYLWHDNSKNATFLVKNAGTYWVTVTNGNRCSTTDSVTFSEELSPQIDLGPDTVVCAGTGFVLFLNISNASILWQDGTTDSTMPISASGVYNVLVTNSAGCITRDTVSIVVNPQPFINLGRDTVIGLSIIKSKPLRLAVGASFQSYLWSNGATQSFIEIDETAPIGKNQYSLIVSNQFGCFGSDTIMVEIYDNASVPSFTYSKLLVFPNPVFGQVTIEIEGVQENLELELFDMFGKQIVTQKLLALSQSIKETIDVSDLTSGTYLILLRGKKGTKTIRLMVK